MTLDEPDLEALLRRAAPAGAPEGFAEAVVAATRRRRRRRFALAALSAAAVAVLGVALGAYVGRLAPRETARDDDVARISAAVAAYAPEMYHGPGPERAEEGFAVQFVSTGESSQRVMMAKIDDTYILSARPNDEMADELEDLLRTPRAVAGWLSPGGRGGAAMAVQLDR